ncbi:TetR/AcrR family transcriptional regulator [Bailinhaonella thermotolerans]|uniref:TetR/AcrR family transcriptional regulator n=1 Tax=Bailinhaonella thermotolerans TaxID=1070861 RepID=A0A3A4AU13_9ACTN|nr:TetR/AcrR family transcriptional regulator [Bailinhaonella thermotolerans]RJL32109.1 TetR/AcrR family transcriptional regulator [Bailinhaonella thermotolerans]
MRSPRAALLADTAIALLAERGIHGLTHRAVDEAAGLPPGSTSNVARTRAALLELTLDRLTEQEQVVMAGFRPPDRAALDLDTVADTLAGIVMLQLSEGRTRTLARYELALEANRRPELRKSYDEIGRGFRDAATVFMAALGSPDPVRHARQLIAYGEGVIFYALVGAGGTPSREEIRLAIRDHLRGSLSPR